MRRRPLLVNSPRRSPVLAMLAAALLLVAPVTARAGGDIPHAHALFQLLADGADGAVDHHHPAAADSGANAAHPSAHSADAETGRRAIPVAPDDPSGGTSAVPDHRPRAGDERPSVSPLASAAVAALVAALAVVVHPLPAPSGRARRLFSSSSAWSGLIPAPEPPPPRPVA